MTMKKYTILIILFHFISLAGHSQDNSEIYYQVIRGTIVDKQTQTPLPGANIILLDSEILVGTISNENGEFRLENIPVGRQGIMVSFIGYHNGIIRNLVVNSARETVLRIELEEKVVTTEEVTVVGNFRKDKAINKMASV